MREELFHSAELARLIIIIKHEEERVSEALKSLQDECPGSFRVRKICSRS